MIGLRIRRLHFSGSTAMLSRGLSRLKQTETMSGFFEMKEHDDKEMAMN